MGTIYQQLELVDLSECFDQTLPLGPDGLLYGTLENGLKYYVRQCSKPKARAALALAVKVNTHKVTTATEQTVQPSMLISSMPWWF